MPRTLRTFYTTESLAELVGCSGTLARNRIAAGEWKPTAQTSSGKALFSEAAAAAVVEREQRRTDGRSAGRKRSSSRRASSSAGSSAAELTEATP